jgi:glycosidase
VLILPNGQSYRHLNSTTMTFVKNLLPLLLLLPLSSFSQTEFVERVDPPFWWEGMKSEPLQLLVRGKDVGNAEVTFPDGFEAVTEKAESPDYLVINLKKDPVAGKYKLKFKGEDKKKTITYEIKPRTGYRPQGFDQNDVMYLLMPDRFANGNPSNDSRPNLLEKADRSNPGGRHGGDFAGITSKLDYLQDLGINTIWLNPHIINDLPTYSYHGYAMTDHYLSDPRFGTNSEFKKLCDEAHKRDIKIVIDVVLNHFGSNHYTVTNPPFEDWFHYPKSDTFVQSNFRSSALIDAHAAEIDRTKMLNGWFAPTMPDMDHSNPVMLKYINQNCAWWIEYAGVDGIRLDTQPYSHPSAVKAWNNYLKQEYPELKIVGESWLQTIPLSAYFLKGAGAKNNDLYDSGVDYITDFPMQYALRDAFMQNNEWTSGVSKLYYAIAQDYLWANANDRLIFLDNHDLDRYFTQVGEDLNKYKQGLATLFCLHGIPMIYYGAEIGMNGVKAKGDADLREDFPGGWPGDKRDAFTKEGRTDFENEVFDFTQKLIRYRRETEALKNGKTIHFIPDRGTYTIFRMTDQQRVMLILNNNTEAKKVNMDRFAECLKNKVAGKDIFSGEEIKTSGLLEVPAQGFRIVEF